MRGDDIDIRELAEGDLEAVVAFSIRGLVGIQLTEFAVDHIARYFRLLG